MRCYHLCNMYLSGIQAGIQSAHAQMELFNVYRHVNAYELNQAANSEDVHVKQKAQTIQNLYDWSENHKTMICLNGGHAQHLLDFYEFLTTEPHVYPFSMFRESEDALNNALTNVAIVLPERIYQLTSVVFKGRFVRHTDTDHPDGSYLKFTIAAAERFEGDLDYKYSLFDKQLIERLAVLKLMS